MLKFRLYNEKDCNGYNPFICDYADVFHSILYNFDNNSSKPFRDDESLRLLKELNDIYFVSDEDWYSVIWDNQRTCISEIPEDVKFALVAVSRSQDNKHTWYRTLRKEVWQYLSDLPFDILIGYKVEMIYRNRIDTEYVPFQIVNYPFRGRNVSVNVLHFITDDKYKRVKCRNKLSTSYWLYEFDGQYYIDNLGLRLALRYDWRKDIQNIIEHLDKYGGSRHILDFKQECSIFEYEKILDCRIVELSYMDLFDDYASLSEDEQFDNYGSSRWDIEKEYRDYCALRDNFTVISHLTDWPEPIESRRAPMIMVDKRYNSSYLVHRCNTVKFPEFNEVLWDVVQERDIKCERYIIVIDVDEVIESVKDYSKVRYGFKVTNSSVEIFDAGDSMAIFASVLKEAMDSGRCKISDD